MIKKGVFKIRPGHLANFSGGAGYMPFVILFNIPASFIGFIVSSIVAHIAIKKIVSSRDEETIEDNKTVELYQFMVYSKKHLLVLFLLSIIASIGFFIFGLTMIYGNKLLYSIPTLFMTVGPFAAFFLATKYLFNLTLRSGFRVRNYFISLAIYFVVAIGFCFVGFILSGIL